MKLFRPKYRCKRTGKSKQLESWYLGFVDNEGIRRRLPLYASKRASERAAGMVTELLGAGEVLTRELEQWLDSIPTKLRDKLADYGMLDRRAGTAHAGKSLSEHIDDYVESLESQGNTPHYVGVVESKLRSIFTACGFKSLSDLDAAAVYSYLGARSKGGGGAKKPTGQRSFNYSLRIVKGLARWLHRERRVTVDPFNHLRPVRQTEKRHQRRALTIDEQRRLVAAAEAGEDYRRLTGPARALIYRTALATGLRAGELRSLTVGSFDFGKRVINLPAGDNKNRKAATLNLPQGLAADLWRHFGRRLPHLQAFPLPDKPVMMIKVDLEAAQVAYKTDAGYADFHSLRHSMISGLDGRASVPTIMRLARHSNVQQTMTYLHVPEAELRQAIESSPDLTAPAASIETA